MPWVDAKTGKALSPEELDKGRLPDAPAGALEAAARGLGQGATLGFQDEAAGALGALFHRREKETLKQAYERERDEARIRNATAEEGHKGLFTAGEIGGAGLTALIPGFGGMGALKGGAALGALAGLGTSEAKDVGGQLWDTAKGAAMGGAAGKTAEMGAHLLGAGARRVAPYLGRQADITTAQSMGMMSGQKGARAFQEKFGKWAPGQFTESAEAQGLPGALSSVRGVAGRAEKATEAAGERLGTMRGTAQQVLTTAGEQPTGTDVANRIREATKYLMEDDFAPEHLKKGVTNLLERFDNPKPVDLSRIVEEKGKLGAQIGKMQEAQRNRMAVDPEVYHLRTQLYGALADTESEAIEKAGAIQARPRGVAKPGPMNEGVPSPAQTPSPEYQGGPVEGVPSLGDVKGAAQDYKVAQFARSIAGKRSADLMANTSTGLGGKLEALTGLGLMASGRPVAGGLLVAKGLGAKGINQRLTSLGAAGMRGAFKGAKVLGRIGQDEGSFPSITSALTRAATTEPHKLGRFAPAIQNAAVKGPESVAAAHFVMQTDKEYQKMVEHLLEAPAGAEAGVFGGENAKKIGERIHETAHHQAIENAIETAKGVRDELHQRMLTGFLPGEEPQQNENERLARR